MTRIVIKELVFNQYNRDHIKKHNVTEIEVITASGKVIYHKKSYKGRYLVIGRVEKRLISLVVKLESRGKYFLVTARDAGKHERKEVYEKEKKQNS